MACYFTLKAVLDKNRLNSSIVTELLMIQDCARAVNKAHTLLYDLAQITLLLTKEWIYQ